jgi:hypothetical protein
MSNYHVSKNKELGLWRVKKEHAEKVSDYAKTQGKAEKLAKRFAANSGGGEVKIHRPDGLIRDSDTVPPGNDPRRIKDKKH